MTETSHPPTLPSSNDTEPYVPLSWTAVSASACAVLLVLGLAFFASEARAKKQPLLQPEFILIIAGATVVLSFIARRQIRESEGTRTGKVRGLDLPATAWWTAVVLGLGYVAYWFAIEYSVRREARTQVTNWIEAIERDDLGVAFHLKIPPTRRGGSRPIAVGDRDRMESEFREDFIRFRQSKIVRTASRNKGECRFEPGGLRDWSFDKGGLECVFTGVLVCPEGRFNVSVPLKATEQSAQGKEKVTTGRQWEVLPDTGGYVSSATLTPYGWAVVQVVAQGEGFGRTFLRNQQLGRGAQYDAFVIFAQHGDPNTHADFVPFAAAVGWGMRYNFPAAFLDASADKLFTLENGATPSEHQREQFRLMWRTTGLMLPGSRIRETGDLGETLTWTDAGVEMRLPVELPMPDPESREPSAARGRLVLACTDAALLQRLKELKASADPDKALDTPPADLAIPASLWRVVRVESNLKSVPLGPPRRN